MMESISYIPFGDGNIWPAVSLHTSQNTLIFVLFVSDELIAVMC